MDEYLFPVQCFGPLLLLNSTTTRFKHVLGDLVSRLLIACHTPVPVQLSAFYTVQERYLQASRLLVSHKGMLDELAPSSYLEKC